MELTDHVVNIVFTLFDENGKLHLLYGPRCKKTWPRGYKTVFILNKTEHEISTSHKIYNTEK